jgi:hypothetical protein
MKLPDAPHDFADLLRTIAPRVTCAARLVHIEGGEHGQHWTDCEDKRIGQHRRERAERRRREGGPGAMGYLNGKGER